MRIGLIDVDGHNFPNLALMRISAYHKALGDTVDWWFSDLEHYDIVYKSKVFSDAYSKDTTDPMNCDQLIKGGTGYCIQTVDGVEVYGKEKDALLLPEIEAMHPDYTIYPQYDFAVAMTSRGCPRGCSFCHVAAKEGKASVKVANVADFWNGQKKIESLDPNILACKDWKDLIAQYAETGATVNFNQGLDARFLTEEKVEALNAVKMEMCHFAWDDLKQSDVVLRGLKLYAEQGKIQNKKNRIVYVLCNFNTTIEEDLYRIYTLKDMRFYPYVMLYNKPSADREHKRIQRWVNNRFVFNSVERFEDYK